MTAPTDQLVNIAKRSQEAVTTAVRSWTDAVKSLAGNQPKLPDGHAVVDAYFDLADKAVAAQREAAQQAVAVGVKAAEALSAQAAKVTAKA
jgi:hypothetical protein